MKASSSLNEVATCSRPNPDARLRLFCFPFAGGGTWIFNNWFYYLPLEIQREIELWSVHLPGRDSRRREPPFTELFPLVASLTSPIVSFLAGPYAFFGHSMGALVSFELACELRSQSVAEPVHLVVSGHRAPHLPDRQAPIHRLPDREVLAKLRKLGGTPEEVLQDPELMELYLPLLRADFGMCENYTYAYREPLTCSVTAFGGIDDGQVSRADLSAWRTRTRGSFSLQMFPGRHFFLQSAQPLVLRALAQDLKRVLRRIPRDARCRP